MRVDQSLKYYPLYTNIIDSDSLSELEDEFGGFAWEFAVKIWSKVYGSVNGYYIPWNPKTSKRFMRILSDDFDKEKLENIIQFCLKPEINFFDQSLFETHHILTSKAIQKEFIEITLRSMQRRKIIIVDNYWITKLDLTESQLSKVQFIGLDGELLTASGTHQARIRHASGTHALDEMRLDEMRGDKTILDEMRVSSTLSPEELSIINNLKYKELNKELIIKIIKENNSFSEEEVERFASNYLKKRTKNGWKTSKKKEITMLFDDIQNWCNREIGYKLDKKENNGTESAEEYEERLKKAIQS